MRCSDNWCKRQSNWNSHACKLTATWDRWNLYCLAVLFLLSRCPELMIRIDIYVAIEYVGYYKIHESQRRGERGRAVDALRFVPALALPPLHSERAPHAEQSTLPWSPGLWRGKNFHFEVMQASQNSISSHIPITKMISHPSSSTTLLWQIFAFLFDWILYILTELFSLI